MHASQSAPALLLCMLVLSTPIGVALDVVLRDERPLPNWLEMELVPAPQTIGDVVLTLDHSVTSGSIDNFHLMIWLEPWWGDRFHPWKAFGWASTDVYRAGFFVDAPALGFFTESELVQREYWDTHGGTFTLTLRNLSIPMRVVVAGVAGPENTGTLVTTVTANATTVTRRIASGENNHEWVFHRSAEAEARAGVRVIGAGVRVGGSDDHTTLGRTYASAWGFGSLCRRDGPDQLWQADWAECSADSGTAVWSGAPGRYSIEVAGEAHAEVAPTNIITADNGLRDSTSMLMIVDVGHP